MPSRDNRKTPVFDWQQGDFLRDPQGRVVTATGAEAVAQIVIKAQQTRRGVFLIYGPDPEVPDSPNHAYGSDVDRVKSMDIPDDVKKSEMERAVAEAIRYDPWITDVREIIVERSQTESDGAEITCTVDHVYGTSIIEGVSG